MVILEYFNGKKWVRCGSEFGNEAIAWASLGGDDFNYRTVDVETGNVLTDKSQEENPAEKTRLCEQCKNKLQTFDHYYNVCNDCLETLKPIED